MTTPLTTFKVGRGADCDIKLHDHSISRQHAVIQLNSDGSVLITDAGSSNGTFLRVGKKWKRVQSETLHGDQFIKFGAHQVQVSDLISRLVKPVIAKPEAVLVSRPVVKSAAVATTSDLSQKETFNKPRRNPETGEIEEKK
jgi:pSer/pThr/pTyr-binding forkhead associated (FHA) protein